MPAGDNEKHVVIVGGGLAGLTAGLLFTRFGYRTTLIEQHFFLGGYLHGFERFGLRFDTGFHYLGSALPGEVMCKYLSFLGIYDDLEVLPTREDSVFHLVLSNGEHLDLPRGRPVLIERLSEKFPEDADGLQAFCREMDRFLNASPWLLLAGEEGDPETYREAMEVSVSAVIEPLIKAKQLREVLYSFCFESTLTPGLCPFGFFTYIFSTLTTSNSRIEGGGDRLIDAMANKFKEQGGTVLTHNMITGVEVEGKKVTSVSLQEGAGLDVDMVVASCHPRETVRFMGREHFSPSFLENLDTLEESKGSFQLYLEVDQPVRGIGKDHCLILDDDWGGGIYVVSPTAIEPQSSGKHNVEILTWQDYSLVEPWRDSDWKDRPEGYEAFKEKFSGTLLRRVDKEFPGLAEQVTRSYASTALTNMRYTRSEKGSVMGIRQDIHQQGKRHVRPRNRLRNFFMIGQSVGLPGISGTLISTVRFCDQLIEEADLFEQLKQG